LQVEDFSFKKWGGEDKLDAEHVRREEERESKKTKKFQKHLEGMCALVVIIAVCLPKQWQSFLDLRKKAKRTPLDDLSHAHTHTHKFGEEAFDAETDKWPRQCADCGHTESYEKL